MPIVGIILGLILAVWISLLTQFNDTVLQQPLMTGNLMPTSVYGPAVLLALLGCGLGFGRLKQRNLVTKKDLVVLVVIGTAACAWPGTNYLRTFVGTTGNPANLAKTQDHWRTADVFSYLPDGVILADGQEKPGVTDVLVSGSDDPDHYDPSDVPWTDWWPVLRLWGGLALLLGLAAVCIGVIVHPQWTRFERLPYPLVRFLDELVRPAEDARGRPLGHRPALLSNKLFWLGLSAIFLLHLSKGLHAWGLFFIDLPVEYDLSPLRTLFPYTDVHGSPQLYKPHLFFSVIAFTFFIRGDVSFSVGISNFVWVAASAMFAARGSTLGSNPIETEIGTMLRAGAYLGFAGMILYLGRRYYLSVSRAAIGLGRVDAEQKAGVWATRALFACTAAAVWLMWAYADLDWRLGLIFVLLSYVLLLILARLTAETGLFYLEPNWMPIAVIIAFLGFEGLGPTPFIVLALFSASIIGVPREPLSGFTVNALALVERVTGKRRIGGTGGVIALVATATLALATFACLTLVYSRGLEPGEIWANRWHPVLPFDALARRVSELKALGQLDEVVATAGRGLLSGANPDAGALVALGIGVALVVGCSFARLRIAWWPIHPVLFFMLGSMAGIRLHWSFLIGWAIRTAIIRLGGAKTFRATLPLAVGMIAGELLAALGWQLVGFVYYLQTGIRPVQFFILPN